MKPNYTPLKRLNDKSKGCKLKVKVLHKSPPAESPSKRRYQKLVFKDDEGSTMKATLFGDDIDTYEQTLKRNGVYEISDVVVKQLPAQYRSKPDEEYQMNLGGRMKIRVLDLSECSDELQYRELAKIPTTYDANDPLLAVVIFVSEEREEQFANYTQQMRDIILADQSLSRPIKLTARNRYALPEAAAFMTNWHEGFHVVGFTGIRPNTYRGLSLNTTLSSAYHADPKGNIPDEVREWANNNIALLSDWRAKAMMLYSDAPSKAVTLLANIAHRKASTIWQDDYYWANISLKHLRVQDIYYYYGCSKCGKRATGEPGTQFYCYNCGVKDATVDSRLVLNTDLSDSSESLKITAYTAEVEVLLNMKADDFPAFSKQDTAAIEAAMTELRRNQFLVRIFPNHELSTANVLKWIVTAAESMPLLEGDTDDDKRKLKTIAYYGDASTGIKEQLQNEPSHGEASGSAYGHKETPAGGNTNAATADPKHSDIGVTPSTEEAAYQETVTAATVLTQLATVEKPAHAIDATTDVLTQLDEGSIVKPSGDQFYAGESQPLEHDADVITSLGN